MNKNQKKKNYQLKKVFYLLMINISQKEKASLQKLKNLLINNQKIKTSNNNKLNQKEKRKLNKSKNNIKKI